MKVLIVGAGMQGQVLTWNLARNPAVTEIVVSDYDEARSLRRRPGRQRQSQGDLDRRL
jgi:saccharopine dehydrogenase-like NADP-dependent oxidoreductase